VAQESCRWHSNCAKSFQPILCLPVPETRKAQFFQRFLYVVLAGMAKAENVLTKRKQLNKRKNMKLIRYQRPGLAWPNLGRLAGLQDELDRLFESPMTGWMFTRMPTTSPFAWKCPG
jgi:hypothetical protein